MGDQVHINARNLSNPGPRLLVENALSKQECARMRVVVSSIEAAEDVRSLLRERGAEVELEQLVDEYHIVAVFSERKHPGGKN